MKNAALSDLMRKSSIKTENQLMVFSDSDWKYCPDTARSTGAYFIFFQGLTIENDTHVSESVDQSSSESEYKAACTAGIALSNSKMLIREFLNMDPDIVPEAASLNILDRKYYVCMDNNGKYTKYTRHISRRLNFVRNGENRKIQDIE